MGDLTRFDFHALRFTKSEHVQAMSDAEVGQYILLLCEAWLLQKDASLPMDMVYLARIARAKKVATKVLDQFPQVETQWGQRLQNPTLLEEWRAATARSNGGRKAVAVRWNNARNTDVLPTLIPKPYQTKPSQTSAVQSDETEEDKRENN